MLKPCICGTASFQHQLEQDDGVIGSPRKPKKGSKNLFSDRGLEKFSALLAELEDKKKEIYTQFGSEEIALIRFAYSSSNRCKPIVVKAVKEKEIENDHKEQDKDFKPMEINNSGGIQVEESRNEPGDKKINDQKKHRSSWKILRREMWRKPSYYLPAIMIMILVFVVLFGRSFAILCTSIGWYMIPTITGGESNVKRVKKKKDYRRRASEKGMIVREATRAMASPTSIISGAMTEFSPEKRVYRKSF